ncbi:MAG: Nif3-like dinuclear metal center hexameric protein [Bacillota bacterium]|nr:Nif3-like dinuclear metal center hexameric protein [Bacillota bacterium]
MTKVKDIMTAIEKTAPRSLAEEWDNVGLMIGDEEAQVTKVLVALDCDENVAKEAWEKGCDMIVTHHPFIFRPMTFVTSETMTGRNLLFLVQNKISLYSAHTNMDCAQGGINDFLCGKLGLYDIKICEHAGNGNIVRIGKTKPMRFAEYAAEIAGKFGKTHISCVGDKEKIIKTVGICGGGGGEFISEMAGRCDLYITGDVKYHMAKTAQEEGLCIAVLEHYESEICVMDIFAELIKETGVETVKSEANRNVMFEITV